MQYIPAWYAIEFDCYHHHSAVYTSYGYQLTDTPQPQHRVVNMYVGGISYR